jgi:hypothetical protein
LSKKQRAFTKRVVKNLGVKKVIQRNLCRFAGRTSESQISFMGIYRHMLITGRSMNMKILPENCKFARKKEHSRVY